MRGAWVIILLAAVLALGYVGLRRAKAPGESICQVCGRPVHAHSRTVAMVGGRSEVFCCPSCAMSQRDQTGKPVTVTQLTDYATGARLAPAQSWIVRGSDVNPCILHQHAIVDADKRIAAVEFDRCAPSLLAFARREEAAAFASQHGGQVLRFSEAASPRSASASR
jgi:hypothetical protein